MTILDRYIIRQLMVSALFAVAVILIILVLGNVFKEILRELDKRPELSLFFALKFVALVIPISLSLAIPFAFLTAILLTFGRLSADSEFVAMRSAGLSMGRICFPVAVVAAFFTILCAWINLSITPAAKTAMEGMKDSFINRAKLEPMLLFPDKRVMNDLPGHLVFATKEDGKLKDFQMIKTEGHLPQQIIFAKEAEVSVNLEGRAELLLNMDQVNILTRGEDGDLMAATQPVYMREAPVSVSIEQFQRSGQNTADKPPNVSLGRIIRLSHDDSLNPETRSQYRTELSIRAAFSLSCLTFGLIGVPLGITAQRRESSAGFILSMIIAVTYYVMLTSAQMKKGQPELYPHLLVWIPNILFFGIGLYLFWKLTKK